MVICYNSYVIFVMGRLLKKLATFWRILRKICLDWRNVEADGRNLPKKRRERGVFFTTQPNEDNLVSFSILRTTIPGEKRTMDLPAGGAKGKRSLILSATS